MKCCQPNWLELSPVGISETKSASFRAPPAITKEEKSAATSPSVILSQCSNAFAKVAKRCPVREGFPVLEILKIAVPRSDVLSIRVPLKTMPSLVPFGETPMALTGLSASKSNEKLEFSAPVEKLSSASFSIPWPPALLKAPPTKRRLPETASSSTRASMLAGFQLRSMLQVSMSTLANRFRKTRPLLSVKEVKRPPIIIEPASGPGPIA